MWICFVLSLVLILLLPIMHPFSDLLFYISYSTSPKSFYIWWEVWIYLSGNWYSLLIICGFCICKTCPFAKSDSVYNPQINIHAFTVIWEHVQSGETFEHLKQMFSDDIKQGKSLLLVSAHIVDKSFRKPIQCHVFHILMLFVGDSDV